MYQFVWERERHRMLPVSESTDNRRPCTVIAAEIIGAGGAGLLEIERCPAEAAFAINDKPYLGELRDVIGPVRIKGWVEQIESGGLSNAKKSY